MSLANKHRPDRFDKVVGQSHIIDILKAKILRKDNNSNNYIFYGPRGTGKTSVARLFAKAINAQKLDKNANWEENDPVINAIDKGGSLDYIEIDAASHTGVDNIREEIISKVSYPPTNLKKKVYVIDEVHMLSTGAFNALLKTIEEPKDYLVFVLATTEIHKVPDTIISRCHVFNFRKVADEKMITHLEEIANKEGIKYDIQGLGIIAQMSDGCVRDAVKYLDQISVLGEINSENVSKFLGVASENVVRSFIDLIIKGDRVSVFEYIDKIQNTGVDLQNFAKQLVQYIDKNLMENIDGYLTISQACSEILSNIRYYPYPAIVYKVAFNKILGQQTNTDQNIVDKANVSSSNANSSIANTNVSSSDSNLNSDKNTAKTNNDEHTGNNSEKSGDDIEKKTKLENTDEHNNSNKEEVKLENSNNSEMEKSDLESDYKKLSQAFINKIDKFSMKAQFQDNVYVGDIQGNTIKLTTISTMAKMLLDKSENIQYIESIFSEILGRSIRIDVNFIKKDDLLQSMLG